MSKRAASGDKAKDLLDTMSAGIAELTQAKDGDTAKIQEIQGDLSSEAATTSEDARFLGATGCATLFS